jgi:two-component system, NtrC family, sensor kinase
MKLFFRITLLTVLIATVWPVSLTAQQDISVFLLKAKLKQFEKKQGYLFDTAYSRTLIDLAYIYSYSYPDSALNLLSGHAGRCHTTGNSRGEVNTCMILGDAYQTKGIYKEALNYYEKSFLLIKNINYKDVLPLILNRIGTVHLNQGNYPEALSKFYESLKAAEAISNKTVIGATLNNIAVVYFHQGNFTEAEIYYKKRLKIAEEISDTSSMSLAYNGIGEINLQRKNLANAMYNLTIANNLASQIHDNEMWLATSLSLAEIYLASDSLQKAFHLFDTALNLSKQKDNGLFICNALIGLAKVHNRQHMLKEALANGLEGLQRAEKMGQVQLIKDAGEIVSIIYEAIGDGMNALKYYRLYKTNSDSLNNLASLRAVAAEKAGYEFSKKEIVFQRKTLQQRWLTFFAFAALVSLAVILWIISRSRNRLNKTYKDLQHKNALIETQKLLAEETLIKLKAAQSQLIQSEKMASLGELTAGIAHEIQNPLNFVNNFSEINEELLIEMKDELSKGKIEDAIVLADGAIENQKKINHHGKRAGAIVKGMLQHSRSSSSIKEPADINKLADEYLRLAYHGFRAKDKSFNATIKTDYDETIGNINIIPQDIGRVILNLVTNAFYAASLPPEGGSADPNNAKQPAVTVSTSKRTPLEGRRAEVLISVHDNGPGIPQKILDKIFQPFFTTKPTGQGTGLGLSLSYDIVKAHGGELKVETKEGAGSEFIIVLPV